MTVTVYLAKALICFAGQCHPALVGEATPTGQFNLTPRLVQAPGYGGDVIQFDEANGVVFAIHRLWLGSPAQRRQARIASQDPRQRIITAGCVNVTPEVYDLLLDCCSHSTLEIAP